MLAIVCERSMQFLLGSHDILCRCLTIITSVLSSTMRQSEETDVKRAMLISWKILKVDLAL